MGLMAAADSSTAIAPRLHPRARSSTARRDRRSTPARVGRKPASSWSRLGGSAALPPSSGRAPRCRPCVFRASASASAAVIPTRSTWRRGKGGPAARRAARPKGRGARSRRGTCAVFVEQCLGQHGSGIAADARVPVRVLARRRRPASRSRRVGRLVIQERPQARGTGVFRLCSQESPDQFHTVRARRLEEQFAGARPAVAVGANR